MDFLYSKRGLLFLFLFLIAILVFINRRMDQKHELKMSKNFSKQNPKNIEAQAKYRKATTQKPDNKLNSFLDYIKMLLTLF